MVSQMKTWVLLCCVIFLFQDVDAQSFGLRAGLNYSKFSGPVENSSESFSLTNGFHFGVNYTYRFTSDLGLNLELIYNQIGSKYNFNGASFYRVPLGQALFYEKGQTEINMKISNAYLSLPVMMQWKISRKLEINAGIYGALLVGPRGAGTLRFVSDDDPEGLRFRNSLVHNYFSDDAAASATGVAGPRVYIADGKIATIAKDAGSYYNYRKNELNGVLYNRVDFGLAGSINYFINKGFFVGFRYEYGLLDVTNNRVDFRRTEYDEGKNKYIFSDDFDRNLDFQISFGFRF
ncbi:MAG: porin family protein [Saprospiraceae bacterium]